jgi:hypothetical protein
MFGSLFLFFFPGLILSTSARRALHDVMTYGFDIRIASLPASRGREWRLVLLSMGLAKKDYSDEARRGHSISPKFPLGRDDVRCIWLQLVKPGHTLPSVPPTLLTYR